MNPIIINKVKEDGTKLEIRIHLIDGKFRVDDIGVKPKKKRKFEYVCGANLTNDYSYRMLNMEDRRKMELERMLEVANVEMLNEALIEAWESIKPEPIKLP